MGLVNGKLQRDYQQNLFNHRCFTEIINYFPPKKSPRGKRRKQRREEESKILRLGRFVGGKSVSASLPSSFSVDFSGENKNVHSKRRSLLDEPELEHNKFSHHNAAALAFYALISMRIIWIQALRFFIASLPFINDSCMSRQLFIGCVWFYGALWFVHDFLAPLHTGTRRN